jgi:hypothetical protein
MRRRTFLHFMGMAAAAPAATATGGDLPARWAAPSFSFVRARYDSGNWDADAGMPHNLCEALRRHTYLWVESKERVVSLDSEEILTAPMIYLTGNEVVRFTERERENLGRYVYEGGFVFADDCNHDTRAPFARTFETEVQQIFGMHDPLHKLSNSHPLYTTFFKFMDGPPATSQELNGWGDGVVHDYLRAIEINGRIGLLYSNKDYGCEWNYESSDYETIVPDSIKFGVNIVAYALTKEPN